MGAQMQSTVSPAQDVEASPAVSVVAPLYNEAPNVSPLYARLCQALEPLGRTFEIILVDDGSSDGTFAEAQRIHNADPRVAVVQLRRNFGQTAALAAGFHQARGDVVVAIDGDLQYDPAEIPALLAKLDEGYDLVSGWRQQRKDSLMSRRLPSLIANRLARRLSGIELHDFGSTFKAYRRELLQELHLYGELHRFVPVLAGAAGARMAEVPVQIREREHGASKYGFSRAWRVGLDLVALKFLVGYSTQPLRVFGGAGLLCGGSGVGVLAWLTALKFQGEPYSRHAPLLLLGVLAIILGTQFVGMGLLAELITRTYHETQGKPIYAVRTVLPAR